jgi:hypothetical protein
MSETQAVDEHLEAREVLHRLRALESPRRNDRALADVLESAIEKNDSIGIGAYVTEAHRVLGD